MPPALGRPVSQLSTRASGHPSRINGIMYTCRFATAVQNHRLPIPVIPSTGYHLTVPVIPVLCTVWVADPYLMQSTPPCPLAGPYSACSSLMSQPFPATQVTLTRAPAACHVLLHDVTPDQVLMSSCVCLKALNVSSVQQKRPLSYTAHTHTPAPSMYTSCTSTGIPAVPCAHDHSKREVTCDHRPSLQGSRRMPTSAWQAGSFPLASSVRTHRPSAPYVHRL
mmetsp:Transcript_5353/g.11711  ORF Transcript_5353/g.11711 Transcript_5353/m.11711 type:complete len:223 (-) Transcript_5353:3979-4647(-)